MRGSGACEHRKLIATDLDGTFLSPDSSVSAENSSAVLAAQEAGITGGLRDRPPDPVAGGHPGSAGGAPDRDRQQRRRALRRRRPTRWSTGSPSTRPPPWMRWPASVPSSTTSGSPSSRAPGSVTNRTTRPGSPPTAAIRTSSAARWRRSCTRTWSRCWSSPPRWTSDELLSRVERVLGDRLSVTHSTARGLRPGGDQRPRGGQGSDAGPGLCPDGHRRGRRGRVRRHAQRPVDAAAGSGSRTWSRTPTPRCWRRASRRCRPTPSRGSGRPSADSSAEPDERGDGPDRAAGWRSACCRC